MTADGPRIDASAFDRYAVVAFGSAEIVAAVEQIRQALPPSGRPILPGHVTVKGTFVNPVDLERTVQTLRDCCASAAPFELTADRARQWEDGQFVGAWLDVEPSEALSRLHWQLVAALADHGETIYFGEAEGTFRPHLTIVQDVPLARAEVILPTIDRFGHRFTWTVSEIALVGRRGGTAWETLATFPLSGQDGS